MAKTEAKKKMGLEEDEEESKKVKWVKHYSYEHQILLVGEGDFSFSLSLAFCFGSASNIVASSLDRYGVLIKKYKKAKSNLVILKSLGASTLHGVDATKMKLHPDLKMRKFHRIIFNFPHAGFYGKEDNVHMIDMHKKLVGGFFKNAKGMLKAGGEIHVSHKTSAPFCHWKIKELAWINCLALIECVDFKIEDYPGYNNKRGGSVRCDEPFPLGECSTFKFKFSHIAKKKCREMSYSGYTSKTSLQCHGNPIQMQCQPTFFNHRHTRASLTMNINDFPEYRQCPLPIISGKRENMLVTNGRAVNHYLNYAVHEAQRHDFELYRVEAQSRALHELPRSSNLMLELRRSLVLIYGPHPEGTRGING